MPENNSQQPTPARKWKRTAAAALLLLLIGGAVVNVAVAWGVRFVLDEDPLQLRDPGVFRGGGGGRSATGTSAQVRDSAVSRRQRATLYSVSKPVGDGVFRGVSTMHAVYSRGDVYLRREPPYLRADASPFDRTPEAFNLLLTRTSSFRIISNVEGDASPRNPQVRTEYDAGWPYRTLRWQELYTESTSAIFWKPSDQTSAVLRGAWSLPPPLGAMRHDVPLPLIPILPGFIINTVFYALFLWLLFFAPFAARRMIRRRRGQCEKCAYPIGVSPVCTECGTAVRPLVARSS